MNVAEQLEQSEDQSENRNQSTDAGEQSSGDGDGDEAPRSRPPRLCSSAYAQCHQCRSDSS